MNQNPIPEHLRNIHRASLKCARLSLMFGFVSFILGSILYSGVIKMMINGAPRRVLNGEYNGLGIICLSFFLFGCWGMFSTFTMSIEKNKVSCFHPWYYIFSLVIIPALISMLLFDQNNRKFFSLSLLYVIIYIYIMLCVAVLCFINYIVKLKELSANSVSEEPANTF